MIPVTKPFLPPIEEYQYFVKQIWERNWLTNNGPLVNELELRLKEHLQVPHLLYVTNGTIALQIAIKALDLNGEIITTPFSYVATTSSIVWEGCKPVFCDIDPHTLNIDHSKIRDKITTKTTAILATHTYGNACNIEEIEKIALEFNLKVIYDAAHAFGTLYKGKSIYAFGDVSTASFHATKIFHTIEGGALFTGNPLILKRMAYMRNFGHNGPEQFADIGINGKNSEFHAAMGLVNLKHIDQILLKRKAIYYKYCEWLKHMKARTIETQKDCISNYSYFPIIFDTQEELLKAQKILEGHWIFPRRYFHPGLNHLNYVDKTSCCISDSISNRVLCLPVFDSITDEEIDFTCRLILRAQNN